MKAMPCSGRTDEVDKNQRAVELQRAELVLKRAIFDPYLQSWKCRAKLQYTNGPPRACRKSRSSLLKNRLRKGVAINERYAAPRLAWVPL